MDVNENVAARPESEIVEVGAVVGGRQYAVVEMLVLIRISNSVFC